MTKTTDSDISAGIILGKWTLLGRIGRGGNGQVWRAQDDRGEVAAIKILTKKKETAYQRFRDEVKVMQSCGIEGVVPILDAYLPDWPSENRPWYAMPEGIPFQIYLEKSNFTEKVAHFADVARVLAELHDQRITHRDIKPANIIVIEEKAYLGDFGLVDYPEKADLTGLREEIGPRWTMAPEIRRTEHVKDARPADVYSLESIGVSIAI